MTTDAKQDAAQAGLNTGEFDPNKELPVSTLALTESDAMNKLAFSALAPDWVKNQIQGQDGMTPAERAQYEEQLREEAALRETQRLYSERMAQLRWEDEQIVKEMNRMEAETWHDANGTAIFKDRRTGKYFNQYGQQLEGRAEDEAKAAEGAGQQFGEWDPYRQAKEKHEKNVQEQQRLTNTYNNDMDAYHKAVAEGDRTGAATISAEASQHLAAAGVSADKIVANDKKDREVTSSSAAVLAAATDCDDDEFAVYADRGKPSSTTRNTSAANQIAPVESQQALKPVFTASASPTPVPDAPIPDAAPKNNVVAPPSPT